MGDADNEAVQDPTPPNVRAAQLPDDPDDEIYSAPESAIDVTPPVDVVTIDHAEAGLEPPQTGGEPEPGPTQVDTEAEPHAIHQERTMRVHGLFRLPDLSQANTGVARAKRQVTRNLLAVYHDTDDLRLARWGITLRRIEGGDEAGWHLELPVAGHDGEPDEIRLPLDAGEAGAAPQELADLVLAMTRSAPLRAVAALRTERTPYLLYGAEGVAFAELVDDTISVLDGEHIAARFRELEVEGLVDAAPLDPLVAALVSAGAVPGSTPPTITALGPVTQEPADVPEPQIVGPEDPAGAAVTAHIRRHARAFLTQDLRVRRDLPDSVHQMRVAARRLRSGLKVFEPMLDVEWAEALRADLGWIAGELGVSRDTEVLQDRIDHHADEVGEDFSQLIRRVVDPALSERWHDARDHALTAMVSQRYRDFVEALVDAARNPRLNEAATAQAQDVLPGLVDKAWNKLRKEVSLLELDGEPHPWHEARIRAKKARYAAEAVAPVMGERVKKFAKALAGVTELLGEHQDAWVAQQTLKELAASPDVDGLSGFSLGLLYEFEFEQELFARNDLVDLWPSVRKAHKKARLG
ncbi:MAG: CYTH and CHAD domain-containing protein [Candidatus Nanopelagicales bacterium]